MTIEELKETAALARLNLNETELASALGAFEQMLGFFAAMRAADGDREAFPGDSVSPLSGFAGNSLTVNSGFFRQDNFANSSNDNSSSGVDEDLLNNAGERDGRFIVIPKVL